MEDRAIACCSCGRPITGNHLVTVEREWFVARCRGASPSRAIGVPASALVYACGEGCATRSGRFQARQPR